MSERGLYLDLRKLVDYAGTYPLEYIRLGMPVEKAHRLHSVYRTLEGMGIVECATHFSDTCWRWRLTEKGMDAFDELQPRQPKGQR